MRYISTRDNNTSVTPSHAILQGISEDGGLFVPEEIKKLDLKKLVLFYKTQI